MLNFRSRFPSRCDRCGQPGHWAGDCPVNARTAHASLLATLVQLWADGEISASDKRQAISDENRRYYGAGCRRALTWPPG